MFLMTCGRGRTLRERLCAAFAVITDACMITQCRYI
jgi:hypothetical protein